MARLRLGAFDFACCEGCQLQVYNLEDELLDLLGLVEPVTWREAMSDHGEQFDVALVEGSITRSEDEERLRAIRAQAKILVALGACATMGGVNKLRHLIRAEDARRRVYGAAAEMPHLASGAAKAVGEVVKVDAEIHGCPVDGRELGYIVRCLALGKPPAIPRYPVCVECKMKELVCRYEYGEICLGPLTRAGCGARCPSGGAWCFGCRGPVPDPNVNAAWEVMAHYGKTAADLRRKLELFNVGQGFLNPA